MSNEVVRPTFSRGWYGFTDEEIQVALDAILEPESMPQESHMHLEPKPKASPIVDKTLLLGVAIDLIADQRIRLTRLEHDMTQLRQLMAGIQEGLHGSASPDGSDARPLE